jgi:hypothetical protein
MEIVVAKAGAADLHNLNRGDNRFEAAERLVLPAEDGVIGYTCAPVALFVKRYPYGAT